MQYNKPFRRNTEISLDFPPADRENWFAFENKKLREFIENWANFNEIELKFEK